MNDQFSKILLELKENLKSKWQKRGNLLNDKKIKDSEYQNLVDEETNNNQEIKRLQIAKKKYNEFKNKMVSCTVYDILITGLLLMGLFEAGCLTFYPMILRNKYVSLGLVEPLSGIAKTAWVLFGGFIASLVIVGIRIMFKINHRERKKLKEEHQKYDSLEQIESLLQRAQERANIISENKEKIKTEINELDRMLELLEIEIGTLVEKLAIAKEKFIHCLSKVNDVQIEQQLNEGFAFSNIPTIFEKISTAEEKEKTDILARRKINNQD